MVNYFSFAKALHKKQTLDQHRIDIARERFEFREHRLERNKRERSEMMAAKKKALKEKIVLLSPKIAYPMIVPIPSLVKSSSKIECSILPSMI